MAVNYAPTHDNALVALRANFTSPFSNNTNGVVLGLAELKKSETEVGAYYLSVDTSNSSCAPLIDIPNSSSQLTLQFTQLDETTLIEGAVPDFECILSFKRVD